MWPLCVCVVGLCEELERCVQERDGGRYLCGEEWYIGCGGAILHMVILGVVLVLRVIVRVDLGVALMMRLVVVARVW